jgi:hypothetical protein
VIVVVWLRFPDVPVMVIVALPTVAIAFAISVTVLVPVALTGLKAAVTPAGRPDADKATLPANPLCGLIVMRPLPMLLCFTVRLVGETESV